MRVCLDHWPTHRPGDDAPAEVAEAVAQYDAEYGFAAFDVLGYGTGELACVLHNPRTGAIYDVRVTRRTV